MEALAELQEMLYAQDRRAVLIVFQAIDALGSLDLRYPEVGGEKLKELAETRKVLVVEE